MSLSSYFSNRSRRSRAAGAWAFVGALLLSTVLVTLRCEAEDVGQRIYQDGVLPNGQLLAGSRINLPTQPGPGSACGSCHRPSGMGSVEGEVRAPPITGNALFGTAGGVIATMDPRVGKAFNLRHDPYTEKDVETLLRTGRYPDGRSANPVMPRYQLGSSDMTALIGYLKHLSTQWSPGVSSDTIRIATVITPDVAPAKRAIFKEMVMKIERQKNGSTKVAGPATRHHMTSAAELVLGTERRWALDIWELHGDPDTWAAQLDELYSKAPVFALVSGLGAGEWKPVDAFCDRMALPCWFPSVTAATETPRYTLYFHEGLTAEARALGRHWKEAKGRQPRRVVQIRGENAAAIAAAHELETALAGTGIQITQRVMAHPDRDALNTVLAPLDSSDAVVMWLPAQSLASLGEPSLGRAQVWLSGSLGAADPQYLPEGWRQNVGVIYPYELPEKRDANIAYFRAWLVQRQLPLVDEVMQSEVFFAFSFFTDTVAEMLDNVYRDYLIERAESMIDRRELARAESEYYASTSSRLRLSDGSGTADEQTAVPFAHTAVRKAGEGFLRRGGTTVYPRLTLGSGQRFASKGVYFVHYSADGKAIADGEWLVP